MKRFWFQVLAGFVVSLLLLPMHFVFAVELSSIYATPTTHLTGASANYKFYLTLNGSASWAGGETMTITFPTGYSLPSFSEDDIDVADDGVDFTTAPNCSGTEQMGVSISGTAVTFEMCAGDGGNVASSSVVEIEMGLNASFSGTGGRQVTNPSGAGSYFIAFSGTFGSGGSVIVPITSSSGSGVSVDVPAPSTGDECTVACGGDPGDDGDPEEPVTDPEEPVTDPEDPVTDPEEPVTDPEEPVTDPEDPVTDPEEPTTDSSSSGDDDPEADDDSDSDDTGEGGTVIYDIDVSEEEIVLPIVEDTVDVIANTSPDLQIIIEEGDADEVSIEIDGISYPLEEIAENVWSGEVPVGSADTVGTIVIEDGGGEIVRSPLLFEVIFSGIVYEIVENQSLGVEEAVVTVLNLDGSVWNAEQYGQSASATTNEEGSGFAWYIPNGTYILRVEKEGYETSETTITVNNSILAPILFISRSEEEVIVPEPGDDEEAPQETPEEEGIQDGETTVAQEVTLFVEEVFEIFEDVTPEEVAVVATPVAVAGAVVATAAVGGSQLWLLLYSFFSQPLLVFTRKKHRKVGIVYNSITKVPLDLVTVRAYDVQTNRLVKTVVTNDKGEFFLRLTHEGTYRLQAVKAGFVFPSVYLGDVREDGAYPDVYTGQDIKVAPDAEPLTVSIPLDPEGSPVPAKTLRWQRTKRRLALVLSPASVLVSLVVAIVYPGVFTAVLLGVQLILYILTWKLTHRKRKSTWGIVYDESTRRPVGNVVIRLFEPKYNKLVDSILSDANGRYVFALGPNEYYVTFAKDGYLEATVKPIDFKTRKEVSLFGINLPLRRRDGSHG